MLSKRADSSGAYALRLWPIDKLMLAYLGLTTLLLIVAARGVPGFEWWLTLHALGVGLIFLAAQKEETFAVWIFRHWYPVLYVAICYKQMSLLITALHPHDLDTTLARMDFIVWGVNPTVWLERIQHPLLTEILQVAYILFVPALLLLGLLYFIFRPLAEFRHFVFLTVLGFLLSYIGYLLVPARGPRFALNDLQHTELQGVWLFQSLQNALNTLEGTHRDCFPSGHTGLTIIAWWSCKGMWPWLFYAFSVFTLAQIFSIVYLRYHYTVDLLAGVVLACVVLLIGPYIYAALDKHG